MNFRKPRDTGLVKRIVRFQMLNSNTFSRLTAVERYYATKNRYISLKSQEEMRERVKRFNFY